MARARDGCPLSGKQQRRAPYGRSYYRSPPLASAKDSGSRDDTPFQLGRAGRTKPGTGGPHSAQLLRSVRRRSGFLLTRGTRSSINSNNRTTGGCTAGRRKQRVIRNGKSLMTGDCGIFQVAAGIAAAASRVQNCHSRLPEPVHRPKTATNGHMGGRAQPPVTGGPRGSVPRR